MLDPDHVGEKSVRAGDQRPADDWPYQALSKETMMNTKHMLGALMAFGLMTGAIQAQTVNQRHAVQQERIASGIASGRLTPGETRRVERQQRSIDRQENRMRARDGGHLTEADRARLQTRENRASRHIYRAKHNGRGL